MATRIQSSNVSLLQRSPRVKEPDYLDFIRELPCLVCLRPSGLTGIRTQAAHIRFNNDRFGSQAGGAEKPDDVFALPLCQAHHHEQTMMGEGPGYWEGLGMEPHAMCLALRHRAYPDLYLGERMVRAWNAWITDGTVLLR